MAQTPWCNCRAAVAFCATLTFMVACGGDPRSEVVASHDLGDVEIGHLGQHEFVVANESGVTWLVKETRRSCACLVGEVSKRVAPGENLHVNVGITPVAEGGFGATFEVVLESGRRVLCVLSGRAVGGVHVRPAIVAVAGDNAVSSLVLRYPGRGRPAVSVDKQEGWVAEIGEWRAAGAYQELPISLAYQHEVAVQRREQIWLDLTHQDGKKEEAIVLVALGTAREWPVSPRVLAVRGVSGAETQVRATIYPRGRIDQCLLRTGGDRRSIPFKQLDEGVEVTFRLSESPQELILMAGEDEIVLPVAQVWE